MKAEAHSTRTLALEGCPLRLTSYRVGKTYYCTADNVDPGAWIARAEGATREEAETRALDGARDALRRTQRTPTP